MLWRGIKHTYFGAVFVVLSVYLCLAHLKKVHHSISEIFLSRIDLLLLLLLVEHSWKRDFGSVVISLKLPFQLDMSYFSLYWMGEEETAPSCYPVDMLTPPWCVETRPRRHFLGPLGWISSVVAWLWAGSQRHLFDLQLSLDIHFVV